MTFEANNAARLDADSQAVVDTLNAAGAFRLCEPASHILDARFESGTPINLNVNKDDMDGFPDEVKAVFFDNAEVYAADKVDHIIKGEAWGINRCKTEFNTTIKSMNDEDRIKWVFALPNLAQNCAKVADARGLSGTAILMDYMDAMRAANQPLLRNWDRE